MTKFRPRSLLHTETDTVFKRLINKAKFPGSPEVLNSAPQKYATLLYPNTEIIDGGIHVHYSFSIPATDASIEVNIKFDTAGKYILIE